MALLETKNLHTYFKTRRGTVKAVNGVSYSIEPGKTPGVWWGNPVPESPSPP